MRFLVGVFLMIFMYLGACDAGFAVEQVYTPKQGSSERKQIADALRIPVEKELHKSLVFKFNTFNVQAGWAFVTGVPMNKNGQRLDYRNSHYQKLINAGLFDDWICALLHKETGHWQVKVYSLGATDAPFVNWAKDYRAPEAIFN